MPVSSAEELAQAVLDHNLVEPRQLSQVMSEFGSRQVTLDELRKRLLARDLLTFYQIENLLTVERPTFHYGSFKVLYLVGTGTFSRVYRAVNTTTGQMVAVKVLRKRFSEDRQETMRFYREGEMGMALKHENIVPIYEVYSEGFKHYLVMEFVEGQSLREFTKTRQTCEPVEAAKLILDVCNGLDFAFQRGILHRDMKMSNVLITSTGTGKLVDFGLAGADMRNVTEDALLKNPNPRAIDYAGLERASGVHKNDPRSDIFFVGCMFYEMVTGKRPLSASRDRIQRLSKARYAEVPPVQQLQPELPVEFAKVINRSMNFNPERRYQTPGEMATDLKMALLHEKSGNRSAGGGKASGKGKGKDASGPDKDLEGIDSYGNPRKLMVVTSNVAMQDMFRKKLKDLGYRVLVTSDPQRALDRFKSESDVADLAMFCSNGLQGAAVEAFNEFGLLHETRTSPAVLLLDEKDKNLRDQARSADHRVIAVMPMKFGELRRVLVEAQKAAKELVK